MNDLLNSLRITQTAGTIAALLGVPGPAAADESIRPVLKQAERVFGGERADRILLYNPDAVALWLYQKYTDTFTDVMVNATMAIPVLSVMPSVTPVCFASMYTGVMPEIHGIRRYEKPVLKQETLFDSLILAGKRVAIVADDGCSISRIFLERDIDYYFFDTIEEINTKAAELMTEDHYDVIVVYNGNYDSTMHKNGPEAAASMDALRANVSAYAGLVDVARRCWMGRNVVTAFLPDHGCHEIDGGCGSHGLDMPEDMHIIHFYNMMKL